MNWRPSQNEHSLSNNSDYAARWCRRSVGAGAVARAAHGRGHSHPPRGPAAPGAAVLGASTSAGPRIKYAAIANATATAIAIIAFESILDLLRMRRKYAQA